MMENFFKEIALIQYDNDLLRNIKSIEKSNRNKEFDDLSDDPLDWQYAFSSEINSKPKKSFENPIIHRTFEEAMFIQAVQFPFVPINWVTSRYSKGGYGVWYGAVELNTTLYETVYHWKRFINDTEFKSMDSEIIGERRVFKVNCEALLLDLKKKVKDFPDLVHPIDYSFPQTIGEYIQNQGHPGLISLSARCDGTIAAIFSPTVLNHPREYCDLVYSFKIQENVVDIINSQGTLILQISSR